MEKIVNPPTPFINEITGNFTDGKTVVIEGTVTSSGHMITIKFQSTKRPFKACDIVLQLSANLLENTFTVNDNIQSAYHVTDANGYYPLSPGRKFQFSVRNEDAKYVITLNNIRFNYEHQNRSEKVNYLAIHGSVKLYLISYKSNNCPDENFAEINKLTQLVTNKSTAVVQDPGTQYRLQRLASTRAQSLNATPRAIRLKTIPNQLQRVQDYDYKPTVTRQSYSSSKYLTREKRQPSDKASGWSMFGTGVAIATGLAAIGSLFYALSQAKKSI